MPRRQLSKRKRKIQNAQQRKKSRRGTQEVDILTPELLSELGGAGTDSAENSLVLGSKVLGAEADGEVAERTRKLSKNELRKMKQVAEKRARHKRLADVFSILSQHELKEGEEISMRPIHKRGQQETRKERHTRTMKLQELGLPLALTNAVTQKGLHKTSSHWRDSDSDPEEIHSQHSCPESSTSNESLPFFERDLSQDEAHTHPEDGSDRQPQVLTHTELAERVRKTRECLDMNHDEIADEHVEDLAGKVSNSGPHRVVPVTRRAEIEECRSKLPIIGMEQEIMEVVNGYDVMVLCGQTGCGKTTQVPQFLYEGGYGCKHYPEKRGMIGVTQPRRVAAISTAERVADEMGSDLGAIVGYQVRHDRSIGTEGSLKFMTDGILMRELQEDFLLQKYSVIIVDEAHERSLNTDLLLGMLSRIVPLRRQMSISEASVFPLKLIIMSATLRKEDFVSNTRLFPNPPPVINVAARQYPVQVHFSKKTVLNNYVDAAYHKVSRIHRELPPGVILVFVTGQREVEYLCKKLKRSFASKAAVRNDGTGIQSLQDQPVRDMGGDVSLVSDTENCEKIDVENEIVEQYGIDAAEARTIPGTADNLEWELGSTMSDEEQTSEDSDEEEIVVLGASGVSPDEIAAQERAFDEKFKLNSEEEKGLHGTEQSHAPVVVLPLYALLPAEKQAQVFAQPPEGSRLIVVATNVAETSITIPNIRYVVDAGRSKQKILEGHAGMAKFEVRWISKAAAEQRAGRAGRTVPGHSYRLYSSAHFSDTFPEHTPPEIINTPLEGVVLMMKALGVNKVANFPFPTSPDAGMLNEAESTLVALSAIDSNDKKVTEMGKSMVAFPVSPRHSRMIMEAMKLGEEDSKGDFSLVSYAVALAAALNEQSPFVRIDTLDPEVDSSEGSLQLGEKEHAVKRSKAQKAAREAHDIFRCENSDAIGALRVLCAFEKANDPEAFCRRNYMHRRNLREMSSLHRQLVATFNRQNMLSDFKILSTEIGLPVAKNTIERKLRQAIAAGWCDQVARRVRSVEYLNKLHSDGKMMRAVRYVPCNSETCIYMHPNSALHKTAQEYVIYMEVLQTEKRAYMHGTTVVDPGWLPSVSPALCTFSEPLLDPPSYYRGATDKVMCWRTVKYGKHAWELPIHSSEHPDSVECTLAFTKAFLEGSVIEELHSFRDALVVPPSIVGKPETQYNGRFGPLINQLIRKRVQCKADLFDIWNNQPDFLLKEMLGWFREQVHGLLQQRWSTFLTSQ